MEKTVSLRFPAGHGHERRARSRAPAGDRPASSATSSRPDPAQCRRRTSRTTTRSFGRPRCARPWPCSMRSVRRSIDASCTRSRRSRCRRVHCHGRYHAGARRDQRAEWRAFSHFERCRESTRVRIPYALARDYLVVRGARRFAGTPLRCLVTGFVVSAASNNCRSPCSNSSMAFPNAPSCPARTIATDRCRSNDGGRNTFTGSIELLLAIKRAGSSPTP